MTVSQFASLLSIAFEYDEKTIDEIERDTQMTLWPLLPTGHACVMNSRVLLRHNPAVLDAGGPELSECARRLGVPRPQPGAVG